MVFLFQLSTATEHVHALHLGQSSSARITRSTKSKHEIDQKPTDANNEVKQSSKQKIACQALIKSIKKKPTHVENVQLGDVVLCKMRFYCEWPALIVGIDKNQINVRFFGDSTTHTTTIKNIFNFDVDVALGNISGRKSPLYAKAVHEAELALGIPVQKSILRDYD